MNTIICPHCNKEVEISQALRHQIGQEVQARMLESHQKELEKLQKETEEKAHAQANKQFELQLKTLQEDTKEKEIRNKELIEQITELTKELRISKKERDEAKFEMEKKLAIEEEKIRLDAQKKAEEEQQLKMSAKDKQLQDAIKVNEELKRKLEQGSQQTQGEVLELKFEELLQKEFPNDKIKPVPKGIRGADIIHEVWDSRGNYNGQILWELKNTKPPWKEDWVATLKKNKREIKAEEAVLISDVLPKEVTTAGFKDGIWVTQQKFVIGLASALRANLIQLYYAKAANKSKDEKVEALYSYLSGVEFNHRIEAIIEVFSNMQKDIEKERRYFTAKWAKDEKNIHQVIDNTFGMHGDLQGILGSALADLKTLPEPPKSENEENR